MSLSFTFFSSVGKFSLHRSSPQTPPPRSRPKQPAPPPPQSSLSNQRALTVLPETSNQDNCDEILSGTESISHSLCKTSSGTSNDSMSEYGTSNVEVTDELSAEMSTTLPTRPSRPPQPRVGKIHNSTESDASQSSKRPVSYVNAVTTQETIVPPPRRTVGKQIASVDENNRTVVHLGTDGSKSVSDASGLANSQVTGMTSPTNYPVPKPRLPAKPKPLPDTTDEYTKL